MKVAIVTEPVVEPVTITEAREHLRVTHYDDDKYIGSLVTAARQWAESFTRRCFCEQTWDEWFPAFCGESFPLSKAPLVSVTGVYYTNYAEVETALTVTTDYIVDTASVPGRVVLAYGKSWPSFTPSVKSPIRVRYVAGYASGSSPDDYRAPVPKAIKEAILLMVGHYYNNRENTIAGVGLTGIPFGAEYLLWPYRILTL